MNISSNLVPFANNGLELVINILTGEAFASQRAVARMCEVSETAIRKWMTANQIDVTIAEIQTQTGLKTANLLPEGSICKALAKYNPPLLVACAQAGLRLYLHQLAGYNVKITAPKQEVLVPSGGLSIPELVQIAGDLAASSARQAGLDPIICGQLCLKAGLKVVPELNKYLVDTKAALVLASVSDIVWFSPTELGTELNLSAIAVNKLLLDRGFQIKNPNKRSKTDPAYVPTELGHVYAKFVLNTGHDKDNSTYQQLRWNRDILVRLLN